MVSLKVCSKKINQLHKETLNISFFHPVTFLASFFRNYHNHIIVSFLFKKQR